jgi:hypothetical protein
VYLVNTKPDICFAINTLSQYMVEPKQVHWIVAKHVLGYFNGIIHVGLRYVSDKELVLHGFTNSNGASSACDKRSTSRCCFNLGSSMVLGLAVSKLQWHLVQQKQSIWQPTLLVVKPSSFASY